MTGKSHQCDCAPIDSALRHGLRGLDGAKVITTVAVLRKQSRPVTGRGRVSLFACYETEEGARKPVCRGPLLAFERAIRHSKSYLTSVTTFMQRPFVSLSYWVTIDCLEASSGSILPSTETSPGDRIPERSRMRNKGLRPVQPTIRSPIFGR